MSSSLNFSKAERAPILWQALLLTFALIFWTYYQEILIAADVIAHAAIFFASALIIVIIHEAGHKIAAEQVGYTATITSFKEGIVASIIAIFASFGRFPLIVANPVELDADPRKRLGSHRQYENPTQYAFIAFSGTIASSFSIIGFQFIFQLTGNELFALISLAAAIHAINALIPWELASILVLRVKRSIPQITPGDGLLIMRWHVIAWFAAIIYISAFALLSTTGSTLAFIAAILFAGLVTAVVAFMQK